MLRCAASASHNALSHLRRENCLAYAPGRDAAVFYAAVTTFTSNPTAVNECMVGKPVLLSEDGGEE